MSCEQWKKENGLEPHDVCVLCHDPDGEYRGRHEVAYIVQGCDRINHTRGYQAERGKHTKQLAVLPKHRWSRSQPSRPRQE